MNQLLWFGAAVLVAGLALVAFYLIYSPTPDLPPRQAQKLTVTVDGRERSYLVVQPERLRPRPGVVFALHQSQGSAASFRRIVGHRLEQLAEASNALVVYPGGFEGHFNDCRALASYSARTLDIDDVAFIETILSKLKAQAAIRSDRVFALGHSNGGHFALRLGLERPDLVKGIGMIAASIPAPGSMACAASNWQVPKVFLVNGTEDPINPYQGGNVTLFGFGDRGDVLSANASADWFVNQLGLDPTGSDRYADGNGVTATQDSWGSGPRRVSLVTILGGGHTVPQNSYRFPRLFGDTFASDRVLTEMWGLFFGDDF